MRRVFVIVALVGIIAAFAAPASAQNILQNKLVCVASGLTIVSVPDPDTADIVTWTLSGQGTCTGDLRGPYFLTYSGSGTSVDLGFCDDLLVKDLRLDMDLDLVSLSSGMSLHFDQIWATPLSTFPVATPFLIGAPDVGFSGAGSLFTRSGLRCPPGGNAASNLVFAFVRGAPSPPA